MPVHEYFRKQGLQSIITLNLSIWIATRSLLSSIGAMSNDADASTKGFTKAASYETYRPSYPLSAVCSLLQKLEIEGLKSARVVDLGAGTGKFTEILASRDEQYEIIAVEPKDSMRGELQRKDLSNVKIMQGEANKMDIESHIIDAVVVAQVSHCGRKHIDSVCVS